MVALMSIVLRVLEKRPCSVGTGRFLSGESRSRKVLLTGDGFLLQARASVCEDELQIATLQGTPNLKGFYVQ